MGISPIPAVRDLERRSGLRLQDFELLEVHEAFASQYLACERDLGLDRDITNVNGSGIGLGHPVGSTGCRLMVTLLHAMRRRGKTLGLATLCGGGGVSMADRPRARLTRSRRRTGGSTCRPSSSRGRPRPTATRS